MAARAGGGGPDPRGLSLCAYYVAANGFGGDASRLAATRREFARDGGEESFLRGLLLWERRAERAGRPPLRPRVVAAAIVGDPARVAELARAGADLHALDAHGSTCLIAAVRYGRVAVVRELLATAGVDAALVRVRVRVAAGLPCEGHIAFSWACSWAADPARQLSTGELVQAPACALALAESPHVSLGDLEGRRLHGAAVGELCAPARRRGGAAGGHVLCGRCRDAARRPRLPRLLRRVRLGRRPR